MEFAVSEPKPEEQIEKPASEPVEAKKDEKTSDDVPAAVDAVDEASPKVEEATVASPAESEDASAGDESIPKATEGEAVSENPSSNEVKNSNDADVPSNDPGVSADDPATNGGTNETVSRFVWYDPLKSKLKGDWNRIKSHP